MDTGTRKFADYLIFTLVLTASMLLVLPKTYAFLRTNLSTHVKVAGIDTVAGYGTFVKGTGLVFGQKADFSVIDPGGSVKNYSAFADKSGVARVFISSDSTAKPGEYKIRMQLKNVTLHSSFRVYDLPKPVAKTVSPGYTNIFGVGGDENESLLAAADFGPINNFEIAELPQTVSANENITFKARARDQNNIVVQNYTGKIHFSVAGINGADAIVPDDYEFKAEDLGEHEFSLGLKFKKTGTYNLVVADLENDLIKGELQILVGGGSGFGSSTVKPKIKSPSDGLASGSNILVSGTAPIGSSVTVYDNKVETGITQTESNGNFSFNITDLPDGDHEIYVVAKTGNQTVQSDNVKITIDTKAPAVEEFSILPSATVAAGDLVNVKVRSEADIQSGAILVNNELVNLSPSTNDQFYYIADFQAPTVGGEYPIDIVLADKLGNQQTYPAQGVLNVASVTDGQNGLIGPPQVTGLTSYPSHERVTLLWDTVIGDKKIVKYKIYFGTDSAKPDSGVETFDAKNTWYIPKLKNGTEYFFSVAAIDENGNESAIKSETVSAIPFNLEVANNPLDGDYRDAIKAAADEKFDYYVNSAPPYNGQEGPEFLWLLAGSGAIGAFYKRFFKKL